MPVPALKKWAKESGKTVKQAEKAWDDAKKEADKKFNKDHPKDEHYWAYVTLVTQRKLGITEKKKEEEKKAKKEKPTKKK